MNCPVCGGKTVVAYCFPDCEGVYRRRKCSECNHVFYTSEYESDADEYRKLYNQYVKKYRSDAADYQKLYNRYVKKYRSQGVEST